MFELFQCSESFINDFFCAMSFSSFSNIASLRLHVSVCVVAFFIFFFKDCVADYNPKKKSAFTLNTEKKRRNRRKTNCFGKKNM